MVPETPSTGTFDPAFGSNKRDQMKRDPTASHDYTMHKLKSTRSSISAILLLSSHSVRSGIDREALLFEYESSVTFLAFRLDMDFECACVDLFMEHHYPPPCFKKFQKDH